MVPKPFSNKPDQEPMAECVVVCTPYSSGCCIAKEAQNRGYKLICLWSSGFSDVMKTHVPSSAAGLKWELELDEQESIEQTAKMVRQEAASLNMEIIACICGGEAGVDLADALSEYMGFVSNGTAVANRRDKKVQQELIKEAGLRSIREVGASSFSPEVEAFLESEGFPIIVKPLDSAGSDGVKLCTSYEDAKQHILYLLNDHEMVNGGRCHELLCQEFLQGKEYVVDQVSRDGVHKTVMVWVYDKRPANGSQFVYFGDIPIECDSDEANALIPYARSVLDALGVANGPSHGEFIITKDGPCLVEMNCRAHGGDGIWQQLCKGLTGGYNQIDVSVDAYFNKAKFLSLPDKPGRFKVAGQCVDLVSYKSGIVTATPGYDIIRVLPSFVTMETHMKPGVTVSPTIDLATDAGTLIVMNKDKDVLERDIALIRHMESTGLLFQVEGDAKQTEEEGVSQKTRPRRSCSIETAPTAGVAQMSSSARHRRLVSNDNPAAYMASKHI